MQEKDDKIIIGMISGIIATFFIANGYSALLKLSGRNISILGMSPLTFYYKDVRI